MRCGRHHSTPARLRLRLRLRLLPLHDAPRLADIVSLVLSFLLSLNFAASFSPAAFNNLRGLCHYTSLLYYAIDYPTLQWTDLYTVIRLG
jgi:hypothetical protein